MSLLATVASRRGFAPTIEAAPYAFPAERPYNAPVYCTTPTYDGTGQTVHPSVVDFRQITGRRWNGWRYWHLMTPYAGSNDQVENPSILVSQDGFNWQVPPGLTNPLYWPPEGGFLSDVHLTYDIDTDELVLLYRWTINASPGVSQQIEHRVARSSDGITWPETAPALALPNITPLRTSPALLKVDGVWWLFGVSPPTSIAYATSTDDMATWSGSTNVTGLGSVSDLWHIDVQHFDGAFHMLIDRGPAFYAGQDGFRAATSLNGSAWTAAPDDFMTKPASGWGSTEGYRGCIQPHEDGDKVRLWYSAQGPVDEWRTGYTQVPLSEWPAP